MSKAFDNSQLVNGNTALREAVKKVDGSGSGVDADTLDGYHTTNNTPATWPFIPVVGPSGIMEVGKYIDFHLTSGGSADYSPRLESIGSSDLAINGNKIWHEGNAEASLAETGYQKLPSGLIIQWGRTQNGTGTTDGRARVTFPVAFSSWRIIVGTPDKEVDEQSTAIYFVIDSSTYTAGIDVLAQAELSLFNVDGSVHQSSADYVYWIAIGC